MYYETANFVQILQPICYHILLTHSYISVKVLLTKFVADTLQNAFSTDIFDIDQK